VFIIHVLPPSHCSHWGLLIRFFKPRMDGTLWYAAITSNPANSITAHMLWPFLQVQYHSLVLALPTPYLTSVSNRSFSAMELLNRFSSVASSCMSVLSSFCLPSSPSITCVQVIRSQKALDLVTARSNCCHDKAGQ